MPTNTWQEDAIRFLMHRMVEAGNLHDISKIGPLLHPKFKWHPNAQETKVGRQAMVDAFARLFAAIPDLKTTMEKLFVDGLWAGAFMTQRGTFTGVANGWPPPTNRPFVLQASVRVFFSRNFNFLIPFVQKETWSYRDDRTWYQQMGI